jgi:hypothetical protein
MKDLPSTLTSLALALAVFVNLTGPDGRDIYINPEAVAAIVVPQWCAADSHTDIILVSGAHICIAESPTTVFQMLKSAKDGS